MKRTTLVYAVLFLLGIAVTGCYTTKKSTEYYGIKTQDLKGVIFIVDISGSMEYITEVDLKGQVVNYAVKQTGRVVAKTIGGEAGNIAGNLVEKQVSRSLTKLQKARKELIPAIKGLPTTTMFNIIVFENEARPWRSTLVPATDANKLAAQAYLESLKAGGGTNMYEALQKAFEFVGDAATDSTRPLTVQAIFVLSDGAPTVGSVIDPDLIRQEVKNWNPLRRVTINTIGLGDDCDENFMRGLALDNGGIFVHK